MPSNYSRPSDSEAENRGHWASIFINQQGMKVSGLQRLAYWYLLRMILIPNDRKSNYKRLNNKVFVFNLLYKKLEIGSPRH
jgi:hypothetical protein